MKLFIHIFIVSLLLISFACTKQPVVRVELNQNWQVKQTGQDQWISAEVPGCIHTDLFQNGIIEDPFYGDNEQNLQWIGNSDWEYKTQFYASRLLDYDKVELVFKGLDTYAEVFLNDSSVLNADNMFREWTIDCKDLLKDGENRLKIIFTSPVHIDSIKASKIPYRLPDIRAYSRKAPYQYGWDWGPSFVTSGIWQPAYLKAWNEIKINNIQIIQNSLNADSALITAIFEIESTKDQQAFLAIVDKGINKEVLQRKEKIGKGTQTITTNFSIHNPELWWPNGMGDQHLYEFLFQVQTNQSTDEQKMKIGLRTIELIQNPDSIGKSFEFHVNGIPTFMKGANYIPQDNFPSRVSDEKYRQTLQTAVNANMNMLRVWGGGIYEKDIFYNICDEKGILVWQDFMFACNMYPGDSSFIENVKQEATQQVKRLRNHPCITIWCGNNEVDEGWHNWGWQKALNYSKEDSTEVWNNYLKIFEHILPSTILTYSPDIPYVPSSPKIGWGHEQALFSGDMHYWGVWWGEEPFAIYESKVGRFMTEFGFQGFPDQRTLDSSIAIEERNLNSSLLLNHQKHPRGMELIQTYMEREYKVPKDFQHYNYVSQLVQAYGIKKALEAHRRAKPYCMGTLYWQLNDCWPVISWSSVDYYNRWKALHYFTKNIYKNVLISFEEMDENLNVYVVSDKLETLKANLEVKILNFKGEIIKTEIKEIEVHPNSSAIYTEIEIAAFPRKENLVVAKLKLNEKEIASNMHYLANPKELILPKPTIQKQVKKTDNGYLITLKTDKLAKNVFLSINREGHFSENYFDLLPDKSKSINYTSDVNIENFAEELQILSLVDTY